MNRLKINVMTATGFAIVAIAGTMLNSRYALAQGSAQPGPPGGLAVRLVDPLPLPVTGTVDGTFSLAPGATVAVGNTLSNPVPVVNVNNGLQPFQRNRVCTTTAGSLGCSALVPVPAGKRLVIEYASLQACILPGQAGYMVVDSTVGGFATEHVLPLVVAPGPGSTSIGCNSPAASSLLAVGEQVHLYQDAGSLNLVAFRTSTAGIADFRFSISGHLEDVPAP